MNRMTELLERINYDLPGLKKAKMCYAQGDADGAMDAVIEHFRTRTTPKYLFTAKEMEQCKVDGILEDAQETLDHYIYGHKFDGEIDWFFNPTEHTSHDNEWTWSLYRHIYWQPLARAYALTKDEKYTKEFLHEMTEWGKGRIERQGNQNPLVHVYPCRCPGRDFTQCRKETNRCAGRMPGAFGCTPR